MAHGPSQDGKIGRLTEGCPHHSRRLIDLRQCLIHKVDIRFSTCLLTPLSPQTAVDHKTSVVLVPYQRFSSLPPFPLNLVVGGPNEGECVQLEAADSIFLCGEETGVALLPIYKAPAIQTEAGMNDPVSSILLLA